MCDSGPGSLPGRAVSFLRAETWEVEIVRITLCLVALLVASIACHRRQYVLDPLETTEIIALSRAGKSADVIILEIDRSRTVYVMDSKDVFDLDRAGVDRRVIDHMMSTAERAADRGVRRFRRRVRLRH